MFFTDSNNGCHILYKRKRGGKKRKEIFHIKKTSKKEKGKKEKKEEKKKRKYSVRFSCNNSCLSIANLLRLSVKGLENRPAVVLHQRELLCELFDFRLLEEEEVVISRRVALAAIAKPKVNLADAGKLCGKTPLTELVVVVLDRLQDCLSEAVSE